MPPTQKITTCLWYDGRAEEAAHFYVSLFEGSRVVDPQRGPGEIASGEGAPMVVTFELAGQRFLALNGGPQYRFSEAASMYVSCGDQAEIDRLWEELCEGGEPGRCGWLKDRYGLSWQIIPEALPRWMSDPDPERAGRVVQTAMGMDKLDIATLEAAYRGE